MEQTLQYFVELASLKQRVHYFSGNRRHDSIDNCVVLCTDKLATCPSISTLVSAIEKKLSRSNSYSQSLSIVPLCILLLCSEGYCVNSTSVSDAADSVIEYCWECLEFVSATVSSRLQEWMRRCIDGRNCLEYSRIHCGEGVLMSRVSSTSTLSHVGNSTFDSVSTDRLKILELCDTFEEAMSGIWRLCLIS